MSAVGYQSDSQLLVETCLARLRVEARLDDDPVLPTIDLLPSDVLEDDDEFMEVDTSELVIDCPSVKDLPSAATIVRESARANATASARSRKEIPTLRKRRVTAPVVVKHARWPVLLCALVATYFGLTAFLKSPLGAKPEVQHVVKASKSHITQVVQTTKSLVKNAL